MEQKLRLTIESTWQSAGAQSAQQDVGKLASELRSTEAAAKASSEAIQKNSLTWTELASQLSLAKQAFQSAGIAVRAVYNIIKEGAALELAQQQFENLAKSINTTADALLDDLRAATRGMVSDAELISGATQIINLGLGKSREDVVRLATAVSTLGLDMQQVILTFANNSIARLDALGLSIEDVTNKTAELESGGFRGDAFDEAVLIGLENKMTLLGDASETTAGKIQQMESNWKNLTDVGRLWLAEVAVPTIDALNTIMDLATRQSDEVLKAADAANAAAKAEGQLETRLKRTGAAWKESHTLLGSFTGLQGEAAMATVDVARNIASNAQSLNEFKAELRDAGIGQMDFIKILRDSGLEIAQNENDFYDYVQSINEVSTAVDYATQQEIMLVEATQETAETFVYNDDLLRTVNNTLVAYGGTLGDTSIQQEELYWSTLTLEESQAKMLERMEELNEAGLAEAAVFEALNKTTASMTATVRDLFQAQADLATTATWDVSGIEEAQGRIEAANQAIATSYQETALAIVQARMSEALAEGGAEALEAQLAFIQLQEAMGYLGAEESAKLQEIAEQTAKVTDVTNTLLDTYLTDGSLSAAEMESLAAAVGMVEGNASLSAESILLLAENAGQATDNAADLSDTLGGLGDATYPLELDDQAVRDAIGDVDELHEMLASLPDNHEIGISWNVDPFPSVSLPGGIDVGVNTYSTGGRVTGGLPGRDSVPALLTPGEIVIPAAAADSMQQAMAFLDQHISTRDTAPATNFQSVATQGDEIHIHTTGDVGKLLRSLQASQAQKRQARGFTR